MHALNAFVDCVKNASTSLSASTLEVGHQGVHGATALAANSSPSNWTLDEYSLVQFYLLFFLPFLHFISLFLGFTALRLMIQPQQWRSTKAAIGHAEGVRMGY
jgi:hypothetical protein